VNCCTIIWQESWNNEALAQVAIKELAIMDSMSLNNIDK